jgi:hypothetical protein
MSPGAAKRPRCAARRARRWPRPQRAHPRTFRVEARRAARVELVVAAQQERAGAALPGPDHRPGQRRGELEDAGSRRRRGERDVDRRGVQAVPRALGEDRRRLARARPDTALPGRAVRPAQRAGSGQPAHGPGAALRHRLGEAGGVDRLIGDVVPGQGGTWCAAPRAALAQGYGAARQPERPAQAAGAGGLGLGG